MLAPKTIPLLIQATKRKIQTKYVRTFVAPECWTIIKHAAKYCWQFQQMTDKVVLQLVMAGAKPCEITIMKKGPSKGPLCKIYPLPCLVSASSSDNVKLWVATLIHKQKLNGQRYAQHFRRWSPAWWPAASFDCWKVRPGPCRERYRPYCIQPGGNKGMLGVWWGSSRIAEKPWLLPCIGPGAEWL